MCTQVVWFMRATLIHERLESLGENSNVSIPPEDHSITEPWSDRVVSDRFNLENLRSSLALGLG